MEGAILCDDETIRKASRLMMVNIAYHKQNKDASGGLN
jgi:hypothetical protein